MAGETKVEYPSKHETEVLLKDGSRLLLRPIRSDDVEAWLSFVSRLSPRTKYLRFHSMRNLTREDAIRFCTVDYTDSFALVAQTLREQRYEIIAIGRYFRLPNKHSAEIALTIEDEYQGRGIGTKLVEGLADVARGNGIRAFEGHVLAENREMINVLTGYGFHLKSELDHGVYHVTVPIARTKRVAKREEERERISTVASLRYLLSPRSVAIIGASRKPNTIGQLLLKGVLQNDYTGVVYPVNPNAESVLSVKAYPSILDVPGEVDLAVIAVPAPLVSQVTDECGRKGVRATVVISDGFRERGTEGAARERELRDITLGYGMRLVGPNCMGFVNTDPAVRLNGSFSAIYPPHGNVAFLSQSGALGLAILEYANTLNIGISTFISVGNRADVSANDLLQYWEQDDSTRVVLLYLESFGNPRKFARIARRVSTSKPIIVVKSGTTRAGQRAASSHTGALATSEVASEALFRQAGMIRVNTLEELFDVAAMLSNQPVPSGRNVAIVTNGGGPGILAADACEQHGLMLPEFSQKTAEQLKSIVQRDIGINNPLDLTGGATAKEYEGVLRVLARDESVDAVIIIFVPPVVVSPGAMEDVIRRMGPAFYRQKKPLLCCFMGQRGYKSKLDFKDKFVPSYAFPEDAVSALGRTVEYGEWLRTPTGTIPRIRGVKRTRAEKLIESAMTRSSERPLWLSSNEIAELLGCYGIRFAETHLAKNAADARATALKVGFPVALKLASTTIVHKTDIGGVMLDLKSEGDVERAFVDLENRISQIGRRADMEGATVQRMVTGGIETIVGVVDDPSFGPLMMFGLGGIYAEMIKDVAVRLHPLTDSDARDLVRSVKMAKLFEGFRGSPRADTASLEDLLLRLSAMIDDLHPIAELDFNPVKVMPQGEGYWVVDARVLVR